MLQSPRHVKRRVAVESEDDEQDVRIRPQLKRARKNRASSYVDEMDVDDEDLSKTREQKKRTAVFTSDEDEFIDEQETPILEHLELSDGDYEAPSVARSKSSRQRTMSWKVKEAGGALIKGKQPAKGKGKAKKEVKESEIRMKDERNRADTHTKARSRLKSEPKDEDIDMDFGVDVDNDSPSVHKREAPASPLKNEDSIQSLLTPPESTPPVSGPVKKKLPPIRKNKPPVEDNPTTLGTSSTPGHKQQTSKPPLDKEKGVPRPANKPTLPNKPNLMAAGQPEINLSDKGVWDSMFKGVHFPSYVNCILSC